MNLLTLMDQLGDDTDLMLKSDRWLHARRLQLSQNITLLLDDLRAIETTLMAKRTLQQVNKVPVRSTVYYASLPIDSVISIMPLTNAICTLIREPDHASVREQLNTWILDGYDIDHIIREYGTI